uniref:TPX2 C-terminal domain-containing protein n=1 Tax=Opuntia streptacantha TaxID=393608 RepID=A0A7C8ZDI0_OPUST
MEKPQTKVLRATSQSAVWGSSKSVMNLQRPPSKENTKPVEIKLHTQQRAAKRAMFNHFVASKLYLLEQQKKQEEKIQKMIEEKEIRLMRKEMVPKAQLMPYFDKPFLPQRSERPPTIPREPSLHILSNRSLRCMSCHELHSFHHRHAMRAI